MYEFDRYLVNGSWDGWVVFGKIDTAVSHLWESGYYLIKDTFGNMFYQVWWDLHFLGSDSMNINIIYGVSEVVRSHGFFYVCVKIDIDGIFFTAFLFVGIASMESMELHTSDRELCHESLFISKMIIWTFY